jgi:hypothetical protein
LPVRIGAAPSRDTFCERFVCEFTAVMIVMRASMHSRKESFRLRLKLRSFLKSLVAEWRC